jgi:signal transduction histidine kinase/CheY-like chemotaxis protein
VRANRQMKVWAKKSETPTLAEVARAAGEGLSREELVRKTLQALAKGASADRIGIWLDSARGDGHASSRKFEFRGSVWNRGNEEPPPEWRRLSLCTPLPVESLLAGEVVEQELEHGALPLIGPLVGLRRPLWLPVERRGRLRGLILGGHHDKHGRLPRAVFEFAAAELALAVELEEEHQKLRASEADLASVELVLGGLAASNRPEYALRDLVDSCLGDRDGGGGIGATFAAVGTFEDHRAMKQSTGRLLFHWKGGDGLQLEILNSAAVAGIWRNVLQGRRLIVEEIATSPAWDAPVRIAAAPLEVGDVVVGVLVAGFSDEVGPAVVERLKLHARLAGTALSTWQRNAEEMRQELWRKSLLENHAQAVVLLDEAGMLSAVSPRAWSLLAEKLPTQTRAGACRTGARLSALFQAKEQGRIDAWSDLVLSGIRDRRGEKRDGPAELPEAQLLSGIKVRLRPPLPAGGPYSAVFFDTGREEDEATQDRHAQTELHSVLEWLEEGVVLFDAQENVRALNSRFLQIAGLQGPEAASLDSLEKLIAKLSEHVAEPWSFAQRWRNLARGIDGGIREELELVRPTPRIVQRMARPILDAGGRRLGRVEIYRDLTTRRGTQSKLLRTEKLAALGQLITGVAHELNNPLTTILGYSQRLLQRRPGVDAEEMRQIRQIFEEAERATTILRQLLLNAHEDQPELRTVAINQLVAQTIELQQASLTQDNIRVQTDLDASDPLVYGDTGQLQQVLMNLTGNARQALDEMGHGGTIRIRTKQIGNQRVLLEVADSGPGIPPENLGRIFDPFFTTKPAGVGTGLGLAIVLGIVREHGGHVNVASPPGGGAIFSIALCAAHGASRVQRPAKAEYTSPQFGAAGLTNSGPKIATGRATEPLLSSTGGALGANVGAAGLNAGASAVAVSPIVGQSAIKASSHHILVVEDEPTVARLIADVLEDDGFRVDVLHDGREALQRAARENYDLVICDMKMPGLDGQHFYQALAQSRNSLSDRFLFVTGDTVSPHTHHFLETHRLPHVAKPFRMEELKEKVYELLEHSRARRPRAAEATRNG